MEYISKESARKRAIEIPFNGKFHKVIPLGEIDTIPAANVAPVVRGKWEHMSDNDVFGDIHCKCSACGEDWWQGPGWFRKANFCPNCGADMRPTSMSVANGEES